MPTAPRIAIIAGEESGDILAADLVAAFKERYPNAVFEGVAGPRMIAQGVKALYPLERLSVMGLFEPLKRLPELIKIFWTLKRRWIKTPPTVFIGVDAPDFNLRMEKALKRAGIRTVHYVSPTVWAWRADRLKGIKQAVDLMLGIFPFEKAIYDAHGIPMVYVGHPLADQIPFFSDSIAARRMLNIPESGKVVALLPGSRHQELRYLLTPFIETAKCLREKDPTIQFITACVNTERRVQWEEALQQHPDFAIHIVQGHSEKVMAASDGILLASGTAALQAMLVKRPSIVAYRLSPISYWIGKRLIQLKHIALPNILAGKMIMPEYIQSAVQPAKMAEAMWEMLMDVSKREQIVASYAPFHAILKKNAGYLSAKAVEELIICSLQG